MKNFTDYTTAQISVKGLEMVESLINQHINEFTTDTVPDNFQFYGLNVSTDWNTLNDDDYMIEDRTASYTLTKEVNNMYAIISLQISTDGSNCYINNLEIEEVGFIEVAPINLIG